jgi:hypothetical protein
MKILGFILGSLFLLFSLSFLFVILYDAWKGREKFGKGVKLLKPYPRTPAEFLKGG